MSTRDEYVAQFKAKLDEWNAEIDELAAKTEKAKAQSRQKYISQLAALRQKRDEAAGKLTEIQTATGESWEAFKSGAEQVRKEIESTLQESKEAFQRETQGKS